MTRFVRRDDLLSWGRIVRAPQFSAVPAFRDELPGLVNCHDARTVLPVGYRRSYGDSVFNSGGHLIMTERLDRFLSADFVSGTVRVEAGVTLGEIMFRCVPHGWFVPVTPGTRYVTVGGAIANDVHGKNHHSAGTFGRYLRRLAIVRGDGSTIIAGPDDEAGLFSATIGGLGLTGIIAWAEIALQRITSPNLDVDIIPFHALDDFWALSASSVTSHEHSVAWVDCSAKGAQFGRGIFTRANWRSDEDLVPHDPVQRLKVPLDLPVSALNRWSVGLFNRAYFRRQASRSAKPIRQHYGAFFHPLDAIADWNKLYGRRGFWQYQCALPDSTMKPAMSDILREIARSGQGSFLAVLKTFGSAESPGLMSFPMHGATLALDFPNCGQPTLELLSRLDKLVAEAGGRLYAAKDGRIPAESWRRGYPRLSEFTAFVDPVFASDFWRRVSA